MLADGWSLVPLGKRSEYLEQVARELQALDPIGSGNAHKVAHAVARRLT